MRALPRIAAAPPPVAPDTLIPILLVVDDEALLRRCVDRMARRVGWRVAEAGDTRTAIGLLERSPVGSIRVVLLDLVLRGSPTAELLGWIRRERPDLHVVLSSGLEERDARDRLLDPRDPAPFLAKPFRPQDLYRLLGARQASRRVR